MKIEAKLETIAGQLVQHQKVQEDTLIYRILLGHLMSLSLGREVSMLIIRLQRLAARLADFKD